MTRLLLLAALLTAGSGAAAGEARLQAAAGLVGPEPWSRSDVAAAFAPDDAFVFADVSQTVRLGPDALAVAERIDRDRLALAAAQSPAADAGRVGAAFGGFVRYGREGLAYATLDVARDAGSATRLAEAPASGFVKVASSFPSDR